MSKQNIISFSDIMGPELSDTEAIKLLQQNHSTYHDFLLLNESQREEILRFIMGKRGMRITYDVLI